MAPGTTAAGSRSEPANPAVTERRRGIMAKCTVCIQRSRRSPREARKDGVELEDGDRALNPACANACPTDALLCGDIRDVADAEAQGDRPPKEPKSKAGAAIAKELLARNKGRGYRLLTTLNRVPGELSSPECSMLRVASRITPARSTTVATHSSPL